jgi:hypothetical protein
MHGTSLATSLLGRRVRLHTSPPETRTDEGVIVTVYMDAEGMHYVVLMDGRLVNVADGGQLTVLRDPDW